LNQAVPGATSTQTDTITVELRSASNSASVVTTAQPILNTDGSVSFTTSAPAGYYWIAVRHRNTIETWSADTVQLPGPVYDFTTAANKAFGDNQIDALGDLKFSMYTGDVNQDDFIDIFDFPDYDLDNQNFVAFEYKATDFNGDGFVDIFDFPIYDANNQNFIFSIQP
jgi:hypothetical protein